MKNIISVTIMVRDSGPILDEFLTRLSRQKTSLPYELVVLYYGKRRDTLNRLRCHTKKIIKISSENFDLGLSRDTVCEHASGKYIVTVSVDALPTTDSWLQELVSPMISGKADIVQGVQSCPLLDDVSYPHFFYWEKDYLFYFTSEEKSFLNRYGKIGLSCVNMAFKKDTWKMGGFSGVSYCEDKIFQRRAHNSGAKVTTNNNAVVLHAHSYTTIESLFKRVSNEGFGWKQVGEKYTLNLLFRDVFRLDLYWLTIQAIIKNELKYSSEILFCIIRPVGLYWGNNVAKTIY